MDTVQGSQQGTELTEGHRACRNVPAVYELEGRRVARIAPTPKRTLSVQGEGVSSDHESAQQPKGRRVIGRVPASQDNSDQPGATELPA